MSRDIIILIIIFSTYPLAKFMEETEKNFRRYYRTGNYKNFYKVRECYSELTGQTHITFTNGIKEFFASGRFKEEALEKVFDQIDQTYSNKKSHSYQL